MSYENHISLNHYWITCQMLCMWGCVTLSKLQKMEKFLGMKRKAPDQCDQYRSVTKLIKTEHKSRDKWSSNWGVNFPWLQKLDAEGQLTHSHTMTPFDTLGIQAF